MPLTQAQYEEREAFLTEVQALQQEFNEALGGAAGFGFGRGQSDPNMSDEERTLQQHRRGVMGVYIALNGGGIRQGSLYPPTAGQRAVVEAARQALEEYNR